MEINQDGMLSSSSTEMQQLPVGKEQLKKFTKILREYKAGKARTEARIIAAEQWWKLRNTAEEQKKTEIGADGGFTSCSAWLHNVITSKHADAIEAYPEPNILPREEGDKAEAKMLSSIVPCILEQNDFEEVYNDAMWSKMKFGTAAYKVVWDKNIAGGLGDIRVDKINLLNVYWEPGIEDIQKSRYIFQTELVDKDILRQKYPDLEGSLKGQGVLSARFLYDDTVNTSDKATVIEVYYHVFQGGKRVLHYCKYVEDHVLYATENEMQPISDDMGNSIAAPMAQTGLYDHGEFPFVFDPLFPIEGSPCGYGFIDLGINPQTAIDLMNTAFVKNTVVGSIPRYISNNDEASINESEMLDTKNPVIHIKGSIDEMSLRLMPHNSLDGNYLNLLDRYIQEMRETTGNTETSTGNISSGVTAASAIAALQEAAGKGSRDSNQASYRAYEKIVKLCIELIRQFYTLPRQFRILGEYGSMQFIQYSNAGLMQQQPGFSGDMGYRKPEFDIKVYAQKRSVYTKVANNEMAIQFFQMGFFNPQMAEQALMCLEMMDFDCKDEIMQKVSRNAMVFQKFAFYMQQCLMMASATGNAALAQQASIDMQQYLGMEVQIPNGTESASIGQKNPEESGVTRNARQRTANTTAPKEG
jgi:hypothetical protein